MKIISKHGDAYAMAFEQGESFLEVFQDFLRKEKIEGGWFSGFGALRDPGIAYFDTDAKAYVRKEYGGVFEALNITGNAAMMKGDVAAHCHAVLSGRSGVAFGGHLFGGTVGGTLEVRLVKSERMEREFSPEIGLNLLK